MATGANDAQGIWQYGEDDSNATFSALMNRLGTSTSTQFGVDRGRLTTLEAKVGLVPITPTTVDKTGGTATVSSTGVVSFTGVSSISLNGIFTSTYDDYRIIISKTISSSGTIGATFNFRSAGTNNSTANYYVWGSRAITSGVQLRGSNGGTSLDTNMVIQPSATGTQSSMVMDLFSPYLGTPKSALYSANGYDGSTNTTSTMSLQYNGSISFDGFTITPGAAFSGTIQVLGYRK